MTVAVHMQEVPPLGACCYIVHAEGETETIVIDPGGDADGIAEEIEARGLVLRWIVLTHSHFDHVGATDELLARFPEAACAAHAECARRIADPELNLASMMGSRLAVSAPSRMLEDADEVSVRGLTLTVFAAPGHDPGHVVLWEKGAGILFSGDVLFAGSIGRSDFPGASGRVLSETLERVILTLPDDTVVYPGHGPSTTIGHERRSNPFLR